MAYLDQQSLRDFLGADLVAALGGLSGSSASTVIDRAISDAAVEIDASLGQVYVVPFASYPSTPAIIHQIACYLAAYQLLMKRHPAAEETKALRDEASRLLQALQSGKMEVPSAEKVSADDGVRAVYLDADDPVFGGEDSSGASRMSGW